ncbi:MAG: hypothetical protein IJ317_03855 [Clostridia bacterium]|nr:hypothetical protein [Clostridia bacterium]
METLLITRAGAGVIWATVLFIICFFAVHIARLASLGRQAQKRMQQDETPQKPAEPPEKKAPRQDGEPIYYIVEKKRRAKTSFSAPKEIKFK